MDGSFSDATVHPRGFDAQIVNTFCDPEWGRREGLTAAIGSPLVCGKRAIGVIVLFARRSLSDAGANRWKRRPVVLRLVSSGRKWRSDCERAKIGSSVRCAGRWMACGTGISKLTKRIFRPGSGRCWNMRRASWEKHLLIGNLGFIPKTETMCCVRSACISSSACHTWSSYDFNHGPASTNGIMRVAKPCGTTMERRTAWPARLRILRNGSKWKRCWHSEMNNCGSRRS